MFAGRGDLFRARSSSGRFVSMPTPRRRTARSKIDEERAHLLEVLRAIEDTARPLIESYVTAERIEYLGGDPIVRRLNRLLGFFRDEVQHLWDDAKPARLGAAWRALGAAHRVASRSTARPGP